MTDPIFVPHQEFKTGLPRGRFRVIVNPERAQKYIKHKLLVVGIALPMIGIGDNAKADTGEAGFEFLVRDEDGVGHL